MATTDDVVSTEPLYCPENEVEADHIRLLLEQAGVACKVVSFRDRAYPGTLDRERPWGEIRVAASDLERAEKLVSEHFDSEPVDPSPQADSPSALAAVRVHAHASFQLWPVARMALLIASLMLNIVLFTQVRAYSRTVDDAGQPIWEWTSTGSALAFNAKGELTDKLFDEDGDGRFEYTQLFHNGKQVAEYADRDGDGSQEEFSTFQLGQRAARFVDLNADGIYEHGTKLYGVDTDLRHTFPQSFDRDGDAFVDHVVCRTADGQLRTFSTEKCSIGPPYPASSFEPSQL